MKTKLLTLLAAAGLVGVAAIGSPSTAGAACPAGVTDPAYCTAGPPILQTFGAAQVTASTASLQGAVNSNGVATTYAFNYGTTTAYGRSTTSGNLPADYATRPVSIPVAGLQPGTLYHARLVAINSKGATAGNDITFTTPGSSTSPPPTTTKSTPSVKATLKSSRRDTTKPYSYRVSGSVKRSSNAPKASCSGTVVVRLTRASKTVARTTTKVGSSCTYSKTIKVSTKKKLGRRGSLLLKTRFEGNSTVKARSGSSIQVFYGPKG